MFRAFTCAVVVIGASMAACAPEAAAPPEPERDAMIHRDEWGVPHVVGGTDADAAFGLGYAQAEDNFPQLEENMLRASGRAAEILGPEALISDWINRSMRIEALSRAEHESAPDHIRALVEGYVDGVNLYIETHPAEAGHIERVEPWQVHAFIRYLYYQRGFLSFSGVERADLEAGFARLNPAIADPGDAPAGPNPSEGSNSWAVAPERTEDGAALLFINPHLPYFGPSQVYEAHVISDAGWNFTGYTRFGFPLPYVGFGEELGWASTDNYADQADAWALTTRGEGAEMTYVHGEEQRDFERWSETVRVAAPDGGFESATLNFLASHHGPVLGWREDQPIAVRLAKFEEPGWLEQWHAMTRAGSLEAFREAVSALDMLFGNYLYADRAGNIFYVYNAAVPRRAPGHDWDGVVDGSDPETDWRGYHAMDELPQLLNPATGDLQNSNGTPFLATSAGNPDPANFPDYMVTEGDNARSRRSRAILASRETFDFETWRALAFDTRVGQADRDLPVLFEAFEAEAEPSDAVAEAVALLRAWDRRARVDAPEMTVYAAWADRWLETDRDPDAALSALGDALARLEADWDRWRVDWGELNRLQRPTGQGDPAFDPDAPSLSVAGGPTWAGEIFTTWTRPGPDDAPQRFAVGGASYIAVVEFGERVRAETLHAFGASSRPNSPHFFDQAALLSEGRFKPAPLHRDEVLDAAVESYAPGER